MWTGNRTVKWDVHPSRSWDVAVIIGERNRKRGVRVPAQCPLCTFQLQSLRYSLQRNLHSQIVSQSVEGLVGVDRMSSE